MNVNRKRPLFQRRSESNIYRMFFWVILILGGIWLIRSVQQGEIKPLFEAPPTPTRTSDSYKLEAEALFTAGKLNDAVDTNGNVISIGAITAYQQAIHVNPNDAEALANLARIQTYSTQLLTSDPERKARLAEALASIDEAVKIAPDDSLVHAIRSFVLDWNANKSIVCTPAELAARGNCQEFEKLLAEADQESTRARQLDNANPLALAYFAEILVDQQKWTQAQQVIDQALTIDSSKMDVHRVHAYVLESLGEYSLAIEAYDKAIALAPNLTFLYLRAGLNYRVLALNSPNEEVGNQLYEKALEYFDKAARINQQLGIQDPVPLISIAKTYSQMGQFFVALRNIEKALEFQPYNPDIYGQLGVIYYKNRNYEGSIPALKCALLGCSAKESCDVRGGCAEGDPGVDVVGLELSSSTLDYYIYYGSALALLGPLNDTYCPESNRVMKQIRDAGYTSDPITARNVEANELICDPNYEPPATGTPAATDTPGLIATATP